MAMRSEQQWRDIADSIRPASITSDPDDNGDGFGLELSKPGHVIVVDDDETIRRMVTRYFEDNNVPVSAASSRSELNRHFAKAVPSLIVLDLQLGEHDGLDLLRDIRSHSDVPVIILT